MWWSKKEALEIAEHDAPHLEDATTLPMSKDHMFLVKGAI